MKMKSWLVACMAIVIVVSSCKNEASGYKIAKSKTQYKIIPGKGKDSLLKVGDIVRYRLSQKIEDSSLTVAEEIPDQFGRIDTSGQGFNPLEVATLLRVGDSVLYRISVDTILKSYAQAPPGTEIPSFLKKGRSIYVGIRILKKYSNPQEATPEYEAENARMQKVYMRKDSLNAIKADAEFAKIAKEKYAGSVKTAGGTLVQVIKQGTGAACDSGKLISMKYEGKFTNGVVFDGNINPTDPATPKTLDFVLGVDPMMKGWEEGVKLLRVGSVAKFFIPYTSGYGTQQYQKIPGSSNLMFDVEIVDVKPAPPRQAQPGMPPRQ
jgi:FKBP-type peptidyl-prolyl cis-trans isomerase FkpA